MAILNHWQKGLGEHWYVWQEILEILNETQELLDIMIAPRGPPFQYLRYLVHICMDPPIVDDAAQAVHF